MNDHSLVKALRRPKVDKLTIASNTANIWKTACSTHRSEYQVRAFECWVHQPDVKNEIFVKILTLCHLLELDARDISHNLPQSLSDVLNLFIQENRLNNTLPLKGLNPVWDITSGPKDGRVFEEGILLGSSACVSIWNCDVSLY